MGCYHHIVQSQPILHLAYINMDPNQSTFHEDRTVKLRMISSQVKMIMTIQNTNFHLSKMSVQSQIQVPMTKQEFKWNFELVKATVKTKVFSAKH